MRSVRSNVSNTPHCPHVFLTDSLVKYQNRYRTLLCAFPLYSLYYSLEVRKLLVNFVNVGE